MTLRMAQRTYESGIGAAIPGWCRKPCLSRLTCTA